MDKSAAGKDVCEEVTRESLIAISYTLPEDNFASKPSSENLKSEKLVEETDYDVVEKFRSELISISNSVSPDVKLGELKG